ncbi:cytochrome c biogenesis CcdA family protein [Alkalihalobacterium chitinilyticum]|uniref:Cytochrome c biogenesis protein CcdA n=1 Tax=Alkalihalobacterium chitinilyticum TaxID=2980103 RepID=A0ABT5VDE5_9BACI|nr:cytochrome c biogenesis protein CcdA [Alkalihalobacterium chitinilyticum]MDE5413479.1 cytochrome c biogenesis protein CcdA [Alkalihalobacterium chitinilyticum]
MDNLSLFVAFSAGMLSFFSPCVFPLIPAYIATLTGSSINNNKVNAMKRTVMVRSISFILGFSIVFILLGASASFIGQLFFDNRNLVEKISGFLIIVFGLQMAGLLQLKFLMREKRVQMNTKKHGIGNAFIIGVAFAFGWTPCVGIVLSSILLLAASVETMGSGMLMLSVYSLGLGIPFFILSLVLTYSLKAIKNVNKWLPKLSVMNGWVLIGLGLLLFTGQFQRLSAWLAQFSFIS